MEEGEPLRWKVMWPSARTHAADIIGDYMKWARAHQTHLHFQDDCSSECCENIMKLRTEYTTDTESKGPLTYRPDDWIYALQKHTQYCLPKFPGHIGLNNPMRTYMGRQQMSDGINFDFSQLNPARMSKVPLAELDEYNTAVAQGRGLGSNHRAPILHFLRLRNFVLHDPDRNCLTTWKPGQKVRKKYQAEVDAGGAPNEAGFDNAMMKDGMRLLRSVWQAHPELKKGGRPYASLSDPNVAIPLAGAAKFAAPASQATARRKRGRGDRTGQREVSDDPESAGSTAWGAPGTPGFEYARFNGRLKTIKVQAEQAVRQDQLDTLQSRLEEACRDFNEATDGMPGYKNALIDLIDSAKEAIAARGEALLASLAGSQDAAFDSANARLDEIEKDIQVVERQDQLNKLWKAIGDCFEDAEKSPHLSKKQKAQLQNRAFGARAKCSNKAKVIQAGSADSGGAPSSYAPEAPAGASTPVVPGFRHWSPAPDSTTQGRKEARDTGRASFSQGQTNRGRPDLRGSVPAGKATVSREDTPSMPSTGLSSYPKAPSRSSSRSSSNVSSRVNSMTVGDDRPVGAVGDVYGTDMIRNRSNSPKNQTTLPYRAGRKTQKSKRSSSKLRNEDK